MCSASANAVKSKKRLEGLMASALQKKEAALINEYGADHPMRQKLQDNQAAWENYRSTLYALSIRRGGLWDALEWNACHLDATTQGLESLKNLN